MDHSLLGKGKGSVHCRRTETGLTVAVPPSCNEQDRFVAEVKSDLKFPSGMTSKIQLISTDFDGTLVSHASDPVFDRDCMELIRELQRGGAIWAINTGRSVALLEEGLEDFAFPLQPDFILTNERDVFRPSGGGWEPFGDWNARCAQAHAELYVTASSVLAEVVNFVSRQTRARVIYEADEPAGLVATSEEEMDRLAEFIDQAKAKEPKFHYQRNTVYLRFCTPIITRAQPWRNCRASRKSRTPPSSRLAIITTTFQCSTAVTRGLPACPANAIAEVKEAVRRAGGWVAEKEFGAGVHEALQHFLA